MIDGYLSIISNTSEFGVGSPDNSKSVISKLSPNLRVTLFALALISATCVDSGSMSTHVTTLAPAIIAAIPTMPEPEQ